MFILTSLLIIFLFIAFLLYCLISHPTSYDIKIDDQEQIKSLEQYNAKHNKDTKKA